MTNRKRDIIEKNLAESRRLGEEAGKSAKKAVDGLHRAARSGHYRSSDTSAGRHGSANSGASSTSA